MVKMTVCLQSSPMSVEEIVSGEVDVDDTSIGARLEGLDGLVGRLLMKEMVSYGS